MDTLTLFAWQFATGLLLSTFVALVGIYLRLRDEWLAALGVAHAAGAGGVIGVVIGWPVMPAALLGGAIATVIKWQARNSGNTIHAAMILAGWSVLLLLTANHPHVHALGQALIDGHLYYTGSSHLAAALVLTATGGTLLYWLAPRLQREALFPGHQSANRAPVLRYHLTFDLLAVATVTVAALTIGIMATFALALLPAWIAFGIARGRRHALTIAALIGAGACLVAFVAALILDQAFGPLLVAVLLTLTLLRSKRVSA